MRLFILRPCFARHPFRSTLIGVGVLLGIGLATIGAVLGLILLATGALVHFSLRAVRGLASPSSRATGKGPGAVIEGDFEVVRGAPRRILETR